ncbi:MAG: hypothetical protein ACD_46C00537G0001 [uncultured bacterium]|nr:MAG: hypothetical protein ACD_46C00537G0001 [uncultured bacterium]
MFEELHKRRKKAGHPPGTPEYTGENNLPTQISIITYNEKSCELKKNANPSDCILPPADSANITWVNVEGLRDVETIKQIAANFKLHPLTVEDILNIEQRSKVEEFDDYLFITIKVMQWHEKTTQFFTKQLGLILGKNFVLSFQEIDTTLFDSILTRLQSGSHQRLRKHGSDYLAYRLIDVVIDEYFVVLEGIGDVIEKVEERVIASPKPHSAKMIYKLKRQMLILRKAVWPMREAISHLLHVEDRFISPFTRVYLRDVYDHTVQAVDTLETFRDMLSSLLDMYLSSLTNRMNEIMKTLTIISTIFIPITALASIYGMNFIYIPGLKWPYSYPIIISVMVVIALSMLRYFRIKKWI